MSNDSIFQRNGLIMNRQKVIRSIKLRVFFSNSEWEKLNSEISRSLCRYRSEFCRKKLLGQPITFTHRNLSIDDFVTEIILLRKTLSTIQGDFSNALIKLEETDLESEIKNGVANIKGLASQCTENIKEIKGRIDTMSELWLQESRWEKMC